MKTQTLLLTSMLFTAGALFGAADRVDLSRLPSPVRKAIETSAHGKPVKDVTIREVNGQTVYDVELERNNLPNTHLRIAENGQVVPDLFPTGTPEAPLGYPGYPGPVTQIVPKLKLEELPAAAQTTIRREAAGREIAVIAGDSINGQKVYGVEFSERGRNPRLYVASDGTIVRPAEKPPTLGLGTTFADTPAAVQAKLRQEVGKGEILKIDRDKPRGAPATYKVEVRDAHGTYELRLAEDGRVLENTRNDSERPRTGG